MIKIQDRKMEKNRFRKFVHIFAVPWCCILPIALAVFGLAGGTIGVFLSQFTPIFLVLSVILIGYANYNVWFGGYSSIQHRVWVILITILAILAWLWSLIFVMGWIKI